MSQPQTIDFNALPAEARQRLTEVLSKPAHPAHILSGDRPATTGLGIFLLILAALAFAGVFLLWQDNFGRAYSAGHRLDNEGIAYAIALFVGFVSLLTGLRRLRLGRLPFVPGRYLLPLSILDARKPKMRIRHLKDMRDVRIVHHHTNGSYTHSIISFIFDGGVEAFQVRGKALVEQILQRIDNARAAIREGLTRGETAQLKDLDPLLDLRLNESWSQYEDAKEKPSAGPRFPRLNPLHAWRWPLAIVLAGGALLPLMWVRNVAHDDARFANLIEDSDLRGFESYLDDARYRSDDLIGKVENPLAHLDEALAAFDEARFTRARAVATGEVNEDARRRSSDVGASTPVDALRAYLDPTRSPALTRQPLDPERDSAILEKLPRAHAEEVETVLLPQAVFDEARAKGSVTALREFIHEFPGSVHEAAAREAIHALFQKSLEDYRAQAAAGNPALIPFMEHLLNYMEANDSPPFQVRFVAPSFENLQRADEAFQSAASPGQRAARISPHFDQANSVYREGVITRRLKDGFAKVFPADILDLKMGDRLTEEEMGASFEQPTIVVLYDISGSGVTFKSTANPLEIYVGVQIDFEVFMFVPGQDEPLRISLKVEPPGEFYINRTFEQYSEPGSVRTEEGRVYGEMTALAFNKLDTALRSFFFSPADSEGAGGRVPAPAPGSGKP